MTIARVNDWNDWLRNLTGADILGINPPVYDFAWFDLWAKPLGLLRILGNLRERGNRVALIDCLQEARIKPLSCGRWNVRRELCEKPQAYRAIPRRYYRFGLSAADFQARLRAVVRPDLILVTSGMTYWYPGVWETMRTVKTAFPDVPVVLGGVYATLCSSHAARSGADFVFSGSWPGADIPVPLDLYGPCRRPGYGVLTLSRGCPMGCDYCASRLLEPVYCKRPLQRVIDDLQYQVLFGIRDIAFYDDALLWDAESAFFPLCDYIRRRMPSLRLHTPNGLHVAQLDVRCCRTLYQTGFRTLRLSLEGIDGQIQKASSGKADRSLYERALEHLLAAGYGTEDIETYILAGLPGQSTADVARAIEYVLHAGGRPKLAEFSPIPGTSSFREAAQSTPEIADEPLLQNNTIYAQYVAKSISPGDLQRLKDLTKNDGRKMPQGR